MNLFKSQAAVPRVQTPETIRMPGKSLYIFRQCLKSLAEVCIGSGLHNNSSSGRVLPSLSSCNASAAILSSKFSELAKLSVHFLSSAISS